VSAATTMAVMRQLFSAYPNTAAGAETVAMYVRLLADIPPASLQMVVDQAIATSKFLPTIAELRDTYHGLNTTNRLTWADGWDMVQREIRRIGSYGIPCFGDELTARVVKSMGWRTLCMSENASTDRAQFRDMYNALAARDEGDRKLLPQAREYISLAIPGRMLTGDVA
jgi:hypothetical protein